MGGAERISIELANSLSEKHCLKIIDFTGKNEFFYQVNPSIEILKINEKSFLRKVIGRIQKINYKITKRSINTVFMHKGQIDSLISIFRVNRFDCIILNQGNLTSMIPYIKSKLPNLKIIAWQHNNFEIYLNNYYKNIFNYYIQGLKQADKVVCLTKIDEEKFKKINPNSVCIYNTLTLNSPIISNLNNKNILFVGRLAIKQKGLDFLITLAKKLEKDWKIYVAGNGDDKNKFIELINDSLLKERIILLGNLKSNEIRKIYSESSVFISTSRWEGFGLVITEAMAAGLPIISFKNIGPTEILSNGEFGVLVDKFDIDDFSNKLNELTKDLNKRKYWKKKSLERAGDFKKEIIIKQWENHIQNIIDS